MYNKIIAELIKNSGTTTTKELAQICHQIYNEGIWPTDFLKTVMIPIEKKIGVIDCSDFRTISLIIMSCLKNCSRNLEKENYVKSR